MACSLSSHLRALPTPLRSLTLSLVLKQISLCHITLMALSFPILQNLQNKEFVLSGICTASCSNILVLTKTFKLFHLGKTQSCQQGFFSPTGGGIKGNGGALHIRFPSYTQNVPFPPTPGASGINCQKVLNYHHTVHH